MNRPADLILPLHAVRRNDLPRVGGKAVNLGELLAARLPVPPGFCVTTIAFELFLAACPRRDRLVELLTQCSAPRTDRIAELSREARSCLTETRAPTVVRDAVLAAWQESGDRRPVAVRSSATVEDGAGRSFAGQFESILNVRGADELMNAIESCWRSLFSERAIAYQVKQGVAPEKVRMAVLVQEMVEADHAGVVFTADPITGAADRLVVESVSGLGEGLVQGTVQPESLAIDKSTGRRLDAPGGKPPLLSSAALATLRALARETERLFGAPQDIEWAERGGEVFLLQARPITTSKPVKSWEDRQVWTNLNTGEVMPDVMTPMTWSMIQSLLHTWLDSLFLLLGADLHRAPPTGLVAGRLYFNVNTAWAAGKPFSFLVKKIPNSDQAFGGGRFETYYRAPLNIPPEDLPDLGFRWPRYLLSWPRLLRELITHSPRRADRWLIQVRTRVDEFARVEVDALSTAELTQLFGRWVSEAFRGWDLLYLVTQAVALPVFQKACRDWLDDPDLTLGYRLFSALGGMPTVEAGLDLWRLAVLARADRDTERVVVSGNGWLQVRAALPSTGHARRFLSAWDEFMAEHGHHCRGELEWINARWSETPDYILELVRGYLRSIGQSDPLENQRRLAEERERLTADCRRRLQNPIKRWIFSRSLRRAQKLAAFREQLKNLAIRRIAFSRRLLLTLGQRLHEQGVLSGRDDIFFLEIPEIEPVASGVAASDWRERIAGRRREYETNLKLTPPPVVVGRFDSNSIARRPAEAGARVLEGIAVSPGVVTGPARVILRADDHAQVLPGEILIAPFTDPAWTPYFVTAAGVVMDQGGILSHGSIIAREYGLPAVTNVDAATRTIRTGDQVEVDGNRGRVTVLRHEPTADR